MAEATTIPVGGGAAGGRRYEVVVGSGLLDRLPGALSSAVGGAVSRVAVIHPAPLADRARQVGQQLESDGFRVLPLVVPDGEAAKDADVLAGCWAALGRAGFTRSDAVVTLGGGATTDLGGFVAATWLRGVAVVHLPTTLLAMVDAAVGGKTGIDTAEGKNLVGAFHEPAAVLCDLDALTTLPRAELVSGMAEVVKCGFIADPRILEVVEQEPEAALTPGSSPQRELVERAIAVKAEVVSADLKESAGTAGHPGREALNYGHTLGHAIERAEHYRWRHGEAIAVGMVYVAELAARAGVLDPAVVDRHRDVLTTLGLPTAYRGAPWADLLAAMRVDKKSRGDQLRFVVLRDLGRPAVLAGPDPRLLEESFAALG